MSFVSSARPVNIVGKTSFRLVVVAGRRRADRLGHRTIERERVVFSCKVYVIQCFFCYPALSIGRDGSTRCGPPFFSSPRETTKIILRFAYRFQSRAWPWSSFDRFQCARIIFSIVSSESCRQGISCSTRRVYCSYKSKLCARL